MLRAYWREILRLLVLLLPVAVFSLLGVVWLFERGYLLHALAGCALLGLALLIPTLIRRRQQARTGQAGATAAQRFTDEDAWQRVQILADTAQEQPPETIEAMKQLAIEVVQAVSQSFHGKSRSPWANFTFPELLLAVETTSRNLRQGVLARVPGSEAISLAQLLTLYDTYRTFKPGAHAVWNAYRLLRLLTNPIQAMAQEVSGHAQGTAFSATYTFVTGRMARLLVEELGRSTIDLYSGRYRLTAAETLRAVDQDTPTPNPPVPVRLLLAGQVNAGKSSLTNALLGAMASAVSELPTPGGMREFRVQPDAPLDLVVLDSPGLTPSGRETERLLRQVDQVDLIVWVAQATQPGREPDVTALDAIREHFRANPGRRSPPMVLVMTHIDKLSPTREWSPPYDLNSPDSAKATTIGEALKALGSTLGFSQEPMVPVALPAGSEPYNLDALWAAIGTQLSAAQLTALDRALERGSRFNLARTYSQCREGGRFLLGAARHSRRGDTQVTDSAEQPVRREQRE